MGDFPFQINYFGNARVTFEYFFPGVLPKLECRGGQEQVQSWEDYYFKHLVKPTIFNPFNRAKLDQWVRVAKLPFDPDNYLESVEESARDVLGYSMVNLNDAVEVLGGFPFDNSRTW